MRARTGRRQTLRLRFGGSVRAISEQAHLLRYDFGPVVGAASVLGLVLAGRQPSFYVNLASPGKQALAVVRELPERDHAVPLSAFLLLTVAILESRLGCD